jgi:sulfoxide reductase heme-binding subunit YedZ
MAVMRSAMKLPWNDYSRRLSPLKLTVFIALFLPATWTIVSYAGGWLGPRPLNEAIHQFGLWTIRFLFIALAITPLRWILQWQRLVLVRRMVGVAAFAYIAMHFTLYVGDQAFDLGKVASEIVHRIYLTIGFTALCGLAVLAATSTDGMVRGLGRHWQRLHRIVYVIALLGLIHYWMQSKLEVWEPTIFFGLYFWLMGYRLLAAKFAMRGQLPLYWLATLTLAATMATALGEAVYFRLAFGAPFARVLAADFSLETGVRPAVVVLALGLLVTAVGAVRRTIGPQTRRPSGAASRVV